jgi:hypothetical protein
MCLAGLCDGRKVPGPTSGRRKGLSFDHVASASQGGGPPGLADGTGGRVAMAPAQRGAAPVQKPPL